jgi:hypothetical protein
MCRAVVDGPYRTLSGHGNAAKPHSCFLLVADIDVGNSQSGLIVVETPDILSQFCIGILSGLGLWRNLKPERDHSKQPI